MLKVSELKELQLFENFKLLTNASGLDRIITNTTILEYESFIDGYHVFHPGDFILTSLFFAKDDPSLIKESFANLNDREISGIAIKSTFYNTLPEDAISYANEKNLPVFLFSDTYMEDIIVCINEVIKRKKSYLMKENELIKFLNPHTPLDTANFAGRLFSFPFACYAAAYLTPANDTVNIRQVFKHLSYKGQNNKSISDIHLIKFHQGILAIFNFPGKEKHNINKLLNERLSDIYVNLLDYYCGVSEIQTETANFDRAIEQSLAANKISELKQIPYLTYKDIGIFQYLYPLLGSKSLMEQYENTIYLITEYDEKYNSDLFLTLQSYIKNQGKISATAADMFQHANTIRYRLQKAEELVGSDDFYEYIFLVMKIYELKNINNYKKV